MSFLVDEAERPFSLSQIYLILEIPIQMSIKKEVDKWYVIFSNYRLLPADTYYFCII